MENTGTERTDRMDREDTLHAGATRPIIFLGLPIQLAVSLLGLGYMVQTNVTGWRGIVWALAIVAPCWLFSWIAVSKDPYGINVVLAWLRTCLLSRDKKKWGGVSCSPLPANRRKDRP